MKRAGAAFLLISASVIIAALPPPPDPQDAQKAIAILNRTKTTGATYALYSWNKITPVDKPPFEEWSAEFNDGPLHRVETPRDRVIANCVERSGFYYSPTTGKTFSGPSVAGSACGINTDKQMISIRYVGRVVDPSGAADRVEVVDEDNIRTYDVTSDGILIRTVYALNSATKPIVLDVETVAVVRTLPQQDIFEAASLSLSVVPDEYKKKPIGQPY
ncbi:hypothetical protein [Sphingomonas oryzagri]